LGHEINHWKNLFEGYKILSCYVPNMNFLRKIWASKVLGLPFESIGKKCHLDVALMESHSVYYREGNGVSF
jgi:hypothetical protein